MVKFNSYYLSSPRFTLKTFLTHLDNAPNIFSTFDQFSCTLITAMLKKKIKKTKTKTEISLRPLTTKREI